MHRSLSLGFTLIELVVVIAIILILAAMLFPVFERAVKSAEATSCLANIRHIGLAAQMYARDHDLYLPPALIDVPGNSLKDCWDILLQPYLGSSDIYLCPADESPTAGPSYTNSLKHSYGINLDVAMVGGYAGASLIETQIDNPAEVILFFDLGQPNSFGWRTSWGNMSQYVAARHSEFSNFVFCAGNAKHIRPAETLTAGVNLWEP